MTDTPEAPTDPGEPARPGPDLMAGVAALRAMNPSSLMHRMGIEVVEATPERLVATMPVEGNTQPYGLLHGGASVVLAETLGSIGAALHAGPGKARRRPRHQRHAPPGRAVRPRHRDGHGDQPRPHPRVLRGRRHRRGRQAGVHEPDHLPHPGHSPGVVTARRRDDRPDDVRSDGAGRRRERAAAQGAPAAEQLVTGLRALRGELAAQLGRRHAPGAR